MLCRKRHLSVIAVSVLLLALRFPKTVSQSQPAPGQNSTAIVSFVLRIPKLQGQDFVIAGDGPELGNWDLKAENTFRQDLTDPSPPAYKIGNTLQRGDEYDFKVGVVDSQTNQCKCAMPGPNREVFVNQDSQIQEIVAEISWDNDCTDKSCITNDPCDVSDPCGAIASSKS